MHLGGCFGNQRRHARRQRGLLPNAADRQTGRSGEDDAGIGEPAAAHRDAMSAQVGEQIAALPVGCQHENRLQSVADCARDPLQRRILGTVGGELERQVAALAVLRSERVQAGEMRALPVVVQRIERRFDLGVGRIAQRIDGALRVRNAIERQRRNDGDESVAHAGHRSKRRGRWSGNGPAHCIVPVDLMPRRTNAPTSNGIWKALTARPAHG